jgi:hypothetical protein
MENKRIINRGTFNLVRGETNIDDKKLKEISKFTEIFVKYEHLFYFAEIKNGKIICGDKTITDEVELWA